MLEGFRVSCNVFPKQQWFPSRGQMTRQYTSDLILCGLYHEEPRDKSTTLTLEFIHLCTVTPRVNKQFTLAQDTYQKSSLVQDKCLKSNHYPIWCVFLCDIFQEGILFYLRWPLFFMKDGGQHAKVLSLLYVLRTYFGMSSIHIRNYFFTLKRHVVLHTCTIWGMVMYS